MAKNYVHYQEYFKNYLGGWSFESGDKTLTIKSLGEEEMYDAETGGKKKGLVMHFEEEDLPMVLNVTNADTIAEVTGTSKIAEWVGRRIIVGSSRIQVGRKTCDAIRVRNQKPDEIQYKCEDCGMVITPTAGRQPSEIANMAKVNFGRVLCLECMKKAKEAMTNAE